MFLNDNKDYSYISDFVDYLIKILDAIAAFFAKIKGQASAEAEEPAADDAEG